MFKEFSSSKKALTFLHVDIDELVELCGEASIYCCDEYAIVIPTFCVYKQGKKVEELMGASVNQLERILNKYNTSD